MPDTGKNIAAVILAAGNASRMGSPKLLLDWHGSPLVRWVARTALAAGCEPVIVVTGSDAEKVAECLTGLSVQLVQNVNWEEGQSTSVRAGITALPVETNAAIILLGDQPQVSLEVVEELICTYRRLAAPAPILLPEYKGRRANPVLFDRTYFTSLSNLQGDAGARSIFAQHPVRMIPFDEPNLLMDVDLSEDYRKLQEQPAPKLPDNG